jgi:hypothetical protein
MRDEKERERQREKVRDGRRELKTKRERAGEKKREVQFWQVPDLEKKGREWRLSSAVKGQEDKA